MTEYDIPSIARNFRLEGRLIDAEPFGTGYINDTYSLKCRKADGPTRYVLQRINHQVFKDPPAMMENIRRVTDHIRRKLADQDPQLAARQLTVIETEDGTGCFRRPGQLLAGVQSHRRCNYLRQAPVAPTRL